MIKLMCFHLPRWSPISWINGQKTSNKKQSGYLLQVNFRFLGARLTNRETRLEHHARNRMFDGITLNYSGFYNSS